LLLGGSAAPGPARPASSAILVRSGAPRGRPADDLLEVVAEVAHVVLGHEAQAHGRAVAYGAGRLQGAWIDPAHHVREVPVEGRPEGHEVGPLAVLIGLHAHPALLLVA